MEVIIYIDFVAEKSDATNQPTNDHDKRNHHQHPRSQIP
jgi:hypothetical protein